MPAKAAGQYKYLYEIQGVLSIKIPAKWNPGQAYHLTLTKGGIMLKYQA